MTGLASSLQTAFQRADGNRSDIKVTLNGEYLKFTDALGRGTASNLTFTPNILNTGTDPSAGTPENVVAGSVAVPSSGGPSVTSKDFVNQVVNRYLESQFELVVGDSSNALREARYASRQLPQVTSWYGVIADKPLASVVRTILNLPINFSALDVDKQAATLGQRLNIKDFQNPAKLSKLIARFVAMSDAQNQTSSSATAYNLLDSASSGKMINLSFSTGNGTNQFSSGASAALVLSTAFV
jgi:hypothetical protein